MDVYMTVSEAAIPQIAAIRYYTLEKKIESVSHLFGI